MFGLVSPTTAEEGNEHFRVLGGGTKTQVCLIYQIYYKIFRLFDAWMCHLKYLPYLHEIIKIGQIVWSIIPFVIR